MLFNIVLGEADRTRLGAPDPLVYDPAQFLVSEATALYKSAGLTRQTLNEALKSGDPEGRKALTWLCLRRADVHVRYSELDFNLVDWVLTAQGDHTGEPADESGDEGNSGALPSEGQTPQP